MASFNKSDLDFILQQILVGERHAAGTPLTDLITNPILPYGIRTVDGTYNNLIPGQEFFGAADRVIPRSGPPVFRDAETGDPDGPGPAPAAPTTYAQTTGAVFDSQPRTISNLISDQTAENKAAVEAAGTDVGDADGNLFIPNVAPDAGLSAPFNSWTTLFGQFFDHGLDLVNKGGSGTVFIPLKPDDPLYVEGSHTNFMVLTRATNQPGVDGILGTSDDVREHVNQTTSFVDQNQTYTSHPSHQVFLREYKLNGDGDPVATGRLLEGSAGGLVTWREVKIQARELLGIDLTDADVTNLPLIATDQYGNFKKGANGYPQIVTESGLVEGNPDSPIPTADAIRTGHAFLDDIAHTAAPVFNNGVLVPDDDEVAGNDVPVNQRGQNLAYDNELLDAHYITGDGRGNENIGLTAVHHIFHAEHNRLVEQVQEIILQSNDLAFINQWLAGPGLSALPAAGTDPATLDWNGERVFQAARFGNEMQYQHLVFEEFARKIAPFTNIFDKNGDTQINASITAEFAHVVYRFGHSMLTETVDRMGNDGVSNNIGLIEAFLDPLEFARSGAGSAGAAGAIIRGMTRQTGNEIDEFITGALRNNLVGLPLDLGAINIARGRDTGMPSLNAARQKFFDTTGDAQLKPYESWSDYALNVKHQASIVNFIAAYGTHDTLFVPDMTVAQKRAAAQLLVDGGAGAPEDREDFLNSSGSWANRETGLNLIDFWIGGLAEKIMPFGGMLGSTFGFVFESQMEALQDGDRMYYLSRTNGMGFLNELEQNSFSELVMRHTDLGQPGATHLPGNIFDKMDFILEVDQSRQVTGIGTNGRGDPTGGSALNPLVIRRDTDNDGDTDSLRFTGEQHVVLGGTEEADVLTAGDGDDTLWGDGDDDTLEGGFGNDILEGGAGRDILRDIGGDDVIKGGDGNDAIHGGNGLDLLFGNGGSDLIMGGRDPKEIFGGDGNDFIVGSDSHDVIFGNEGDDWIEGGAQNDLLQGENGNVFQNSPIVGHDVIIGNGGDDDYDAESGDDIMVAGSGIERNEGMLGFDWVTHKDDPQAANADMAFTGLLPIELDTLRDRFDGVEGLSGWRFNDILHGDDRVADADADVENAFAGHELTNPDLITGLSALLGPRTTPFTGGNILLGGAGSDLIEGRGGNDVIDGDAWLNVRLSVRDPLNPNLELRSASTLGELQADIFAKRIDPGQIRIVREIITEANGSSVDVALFSDILDNYDIADLGNGRFSVTHARGTQQDGTDVIQNVERLQFSDQLRVLDGTNLPATGTVTISDTTPTEDQTLTATRAFNDPNVVNTATIQYIWQSETEPGVWSDVGVGANFTVGDLQAGKALRVMAKFNDGLNSPEFVISDPTAAVVNLNDAPTGAPAISDTTPVAEEALTVTTDTIADGDGLVGVVFQYQWQRSTATGFADIAGATLASFTPTDAHAGSQLRVVVRYTDNQGTAEQVVSAATSAVTGTTPPPPPNTPATGQPALSDTTPTEGVALTALRGTIEDANGVPAETAFTYQWQAGTGTTFTDIAGATGASFTPTQTQVGSQLRVIVRYTDNAGHSEQLTSSASAGIGDLVIGDVNANTLSGTGFADNLQGRAGNDTLNGFGADDVLLGEEGDDTLNGGTGIDSMNGGTGNDTYAVDNVGDVVTEAAGSGTDTVRTTLATYTLAATLENLTYTGTGTFTGTGNDVNNVLTGAAGIDNLNGGLGNDTLNGGEGADTLRGGGGADQLNGGGANDFLNGDGGADAMAGGFGSDTYIVDNVGDTVTEAAGAGTGTDLVRTTLSSYTIGANVENLTYTGIGAFTGNGNELVNVLTGAAGADTLNGLGGNDTLNGGVGNDIMNGGAGNDIFLFTAAGFGADRISGFDANATDGQDRLNVSGLGITAANFSSRVAITDIGADVRVAIGADSIVLVGIADATTVNASDFLLA